LRNTLGSTLLALSLASSAWSAPPAPEHADFVGAVERVVETVADKDYDAFEALFTEVTKGMQPDELWRGAFGVVGKFGAIQKVEFSELDESSGGAFVKVFFERATREVFLRLTEDRKIEELTYVPPMNADP